MRLEDLCELNNTGESDIYRPLVEIENVKTHQLPDLSMVSQSIEPLA